MRGSWCVWAEPPEVPAELADRGAKILPGCAALAQWPVQLTIGLQSAPGMADPSIEAFCQPVLIIADVVHQGSTFAELFALLRDWIAEDHAQWDVIRRKLRFVGVTVKRKTSPNTFRWQQHASWTRLLPARSVLNVSLDWPNWTYLADHQVKLTRTFTRDLWLADATGPDHGEATRRALAEAVALVAYGRSADGRTKLARAIAGEPARSRRGGHAPSGRILYAK